MNKVLISSDMGCAYRWSAEYQCLEWCPLYANGLMDEENWGCVEEDMVGEEITTFNGEEKTLSEVYRQVESILREA